MITHIVFFKFKDAAHIDRAKHDLLALKEKIPQIRHLEVGVDILRTERSYDLALIAKFDSLADLQSYQIHPAHQEVVKFIAEVRESVVAVDYQSE
ncbi:Dabb family protein [Desulforamulus hydrothermalis]|uniref:Stress responsive alpha-beta barrel domain protein n=1 Tax=Desulforamulus hydrothermalis Lam5 = DSM 18033 TaxID=1121428 RepID=K8EFI9_9FIRM|nr:Dabb family protein [Desulforamulus hydrothermalis]CCO07446.1 Stress responsive alpha-beta barrel domain protein [Desulforamulus hydrothermalis Lam5 = DSM 18033]SHH18314.1 Stress responsive A/B Barrel Domain [Desulforamulus hydrothermalis Lam5 = DSM 18033]